MAERAIITACSGDAGYFEAFIRDFWQSLDACTDLSDTDVLLIDYGLSDAQRAEAQAAGIEVVPGARDGSVPNVRWRDLVNVIDRGAYVQILQADGSDMYFQRDVSGIFDATRERIGVASEAWGALSRDHYLKLSTDCMSWEEIRFCVRHTPINTGLVCGPADAMRALANEIAERIVGEGKGVAGPDYTVANLILHRDGFVELGETNNFIPITSRHMPTVIDGKLCSEGEPVHVIHNAAAGFGVFEGFGFPNDGLRLNAKILRKLRRGWIRYARMLRTPVVRRFTWGGRALASTGETGPVA